MRGLVLGTAQWTVQLARGVPMHFLRSVCMALAGLSALLVPAVAAAEHEIAGLKLGMSPQQAKAALMAFGVDPSRIQESKSAYRFTDGVNGHSTADFLDRMTADKQEQKEGQRVEDNFELVFAPPPKGGQLVLVRRLTSNPVNPPTVAQYRAAITEKHGKPNAEQSGSLTWTDPVGAVNCLPNANSTRDVSGVMSSIYMGSAKTGWRLNHLRNANKVRHPSQCARVLQYTMLSSPNQPARQVTAVMVDVPAWGSAYLDTLEWVEAQRQEAIKDREGKASKPKL